LKGKQKHKSKEKSKAKHKVQDITTITTSEAIEQPASASSSAKEPDASVLNTPTNANTSGANTSGADAKAAAAEPFMSLVRELVHTYQAFSRYSEQHVRELGLTPSQFEVIATLGNNPGLSMKEIGDRTLITKGTLTGVVDRLEQKDLLRREVPEGNRRSFTIVLTAAGEDCFNQVFTAHIAYLKERFNNLSPADMTQIQSALTQLKALF
jgi:MarR family 2-MHQ and catechol resistance regulon transcriptional repressor